MVTTSDQIDADAYDARRQIANLLTGTDGCGTPRSRSNRLVTGGSALGALLMGIAIVVGMLGRGADDMVPADGAIVVKESGDRYVIVNGVLHPALNLASAQLVGGGKPTTVSRSTIAKLPRGLPLGIPGAPDSLPPASSTSTGPWTVCSVAQENKSLPPGVTVLIGAPTPAPVASGYALLVTDTTTVWLLFDGRRIVVPPPSAALLGLAGGSTTVLPSAVINTIPESAALVVPKIDGVGTAPQVALSFGAVVGDLVSSPIAGGGSSRYVVLADGLAPINDIEYRLLAGQAPHRLQVDASVASAVLSGQKAPGSDDWPTTVPEIVGPRPSAPVCLTYDSEQPAAGAAWPLSTSLPQRLPTPAGSTPITSAELSAGVSIPQVVLASGQGLVVKGTTASGVDGRFALVTEVGVRCAISTPDAVKRLGFSAESAPLVPTPFLALLPAGPVLDPEAAAKEFIVDTPSEPTPASAGSSP